MLVRYDTTYQDFKHAQLLHRRTNKRARWTYLFWYWLMPVLGVAAAIALTVDIGFHHFSFPPLLAGVLGGLLWGGLFPLVYRPFQMRALYKRMLNGRSKDSFVEFELTGDELISRYPTRSEGRFRRAAVLGFAEDDVLALFYLGKKLFLIVPKRAMSAAEAAEIRAWLTTAPAPEGTHAH